ncbi:MAG TPA: DUF484 family protein [Paracoccaceae bacterium]|nr:DUF484 family protein [Paracoccaceae bacterium]
MDAFSLSDDERDLVRSLIVADPDLVLGDDQVMRRLIGERTGERQVVDLRDRLVERLESRLEKMVAHHRTVVAAAYENVEGARQLHRAVLALIEPPDLSSFLHRLTHDVPRMLGLDEARLCLEADVAETGPAAGFGEDLHGRVMALPEGTVADYMSLDGGHAGPVVLREAGADSELVFGEANPVQSEALMRLDIPGSAGMLAFGSADARKFDPSHGTDLLAFFGGAVERLLLQRLSDTGE